jgi:hypothetical protein
MVKKSDAMLQREKWSEETMMHKPKHKNEGAIVRHSGLNGVYRQLTAPIAAVGFN